LSVRRQNMTVPRLLKDLILCLPGGQTVRRHYWSVRSALAPGGFLRHPYGSFQEYFSPNSTRARRYDRETIAIMARVLTPASNCVDIGASEGSILRHMVALAPDGRHYAFEPLPGKASVLRAAFPTVEVLELALSDSPGRSCQEVCK
jgi:hypothetical protein